MRKPHVVPLSPQAIELLDEMLKVRTGENVFPSPIGLKPISRVQCWRVTQAVTDNAGTNHGWRSTFRYGAPLMASIARLRSSKSPT